MQVRANGAIREGKKGSARETFSAEHRGRCPRYTEWVKGIGRFAHGADAQGRPVNWHGYLETCTKCGANLFADMGDVQSGSDIIKWWLGEDEPVIAAPPGADGSTP